MKILLLTNVNFIISRGTLYDQNDYYHALYITKINRIEDLKFKKKMNKS